MAMVFDRDSFTRQYELEKQRWLQEKYMQAHQNANPYSQGLMQSSPQRSQEPQKPQEPIADDWFVVQ